MTMTYGEKMALKTPVSREEAERVLAKDGIGCGAVMALRFARTLLATMTELEQVKGERDAAQRDAHGWKVQLGKIASLVPISQIVRVTGTTKDLIEWLTDRVAVAERATAAEAANAALTARSEALVVANRALKPFADRVFNDNGDCTISDTHTLTPADYWNAQIAERVSSDALSADAAKA